MRKMINANERARLLSEYQSSGLTQREFCHKAGIGASTLSKWLNGHKAVGGDDNFIEVVSDGYEVVCKGVTIKVPVSLGVKGVLNLVQELC